MQTIGDDEDVDFNPAMIHIRKSSLISLGKENQNGDGVAQQSHVTKPKGARYLYAGLQWGWLKSKRVSFVWGIHAVVRKEIFVVQYIATSSATAVTTYRVM